MSDSRGLLGPAEVRELAERLGVSPTKKLGQNFVIDPNTVRKIVRLAGVEAGDRVIEIGPGLGSLTLGITEAGAEVTAVEIDHRLAAELSSTARTMQPEIFADPEQPRLRVIRSDALEVTLQDLLDQSSGHSAATESIAESTPLKRSCDSSVTQDDEGNGERGAGDAARLLPEVLVANLPYNVSVPILMHLLELIPGLRRGLVMVQSEVGHRIAAGPGSKEYGAPSAKAAWYGNWRIAGTVSRRIFWPVPGVDSVLVGYDRLAEPRGDEAERRLTFDLVNAAFAQRRKMLRQALQPVLGPLDRAVAVIEGAGLDPTARAEQFGIEDYLAIARFRARSS
ncbi:ribosomal RNA small subunit methyltransferase A [Leucobacter celer]|uniref:ribosomal RNA small subunit methyltransferase A n=1 Tax=Leucobacter celer TaxID=668625 RepID=UPI0006A77ED7|nr:rRNA adenine dimethyltransferase family protein [Leucobacter celer]